MNIIKNIYKNQEIKIDQHENSINKVKDNYLNQKNDLKKIKTIEPTNIFNELNNNILFSLDEKDKKIDSKRVNIKEKQTSSILQSIKSENIDVSTINSDTPSSIKSYDSISSPKEKIVARRLFADEGPSSTSTTPIPKNTQANNIQKEDSNYIEDDIFTKLASARAHFRIPSKLAEMYAALESYASEIRNLNRYGNECIKVFNMQKKIPQDKRKKSSYALFYTSEAINILNKNDKHKKAFNDIQKGIETIISEAKKEMGVDKSGSPTKVRVKAVNSPESGKGAGLDEAFKTSETEYFFYCTSDLIEGKKWYSLTNKKDKITWLDLQRDARISVKQSIRNDGNGHDSALFSDKKYINDKEFKLEGKLKGGDVKYHDNRHAEIEKSSSPLNALYRAYRYMKKELISRKAYAQGDVFKKIKGSNKVHNTRSTTAKNAPKIEKSVFTVDGRDLNDKYQRLDQANSLIITLRRSIVDLLKGIKEYRLLEDTNDTLSIRTDDTQYSDFENSEFDEIERKLFSKKIGSGYKTNNTEKDITETIKPH